MNTSSTENSNLLIAGASTRAAAASALRAGLRPVCVDQFGDQDLQRIAQVITKTERAADWLPLLDQLPAMNWIYTGALENQPELIERIQQKHHLLGCGPDSLKFARDPFYLEQLLSGNQIESAACLPANTMPADPENWLCKPVQSSAGQGIHSLDLNSPPLLDTQSHYLQRYQAGFPLSGLFIAFPQAVILVGLASQFSGNPLLQAARFQFCGGVTLAPIPPVFRAALQELGTSLARGCALRGLFGCDLIWSPDQGERFWFTEVNPRYTALTELFELQYRVPLLDWHKTACHAFESSQSEAPAIDFETRLRKAEKQPLLQISKGILYSREERSAPDLSDRLTDKGSFAVPESADLPNVGTTIPAGTPFCSVYGTGPDQKASLEMLEIRIREYYSLLTVDTQSKEQGFDSMAGLWPFESLPERYFPGFS